MNEHNFNWNRPIEEVILSFCTEMASNMERASNAHRETGWFANNTLSNNLSCMAKAYRTVEKHILSEIRIRNSIQQK
jgi:hypothetical protein